MHPHKDKKERTSPQKNLPSKIRAGRQDISGIRSFEQTPSDNAAGTRPDVPPHELFYLFTASIILEKKVFIR